MTAYEHMRLSHYAEPAGQLALGGKSALDAAVHDLPNAVEILPNLNPLKSFHEVGNTDALFFAVFFYLRKIFKRVDLGRLRVLVPLDLYRAASDAEYPALAYDVSVFVKRREVERVGVGDIGSGQV